MIVMRMTQSGTLCSRKLFYPFRKMDGESLNGRKISVERSKGGRGGSLRHDSISFIVLLSFECMIIGEVDCAGLDLACRVVAEVAVTAWKLKVWMSAN